MPRRRDRRITINRAFVSIEQFIADYATDLSRSGVLLRSKNPLPPGTQVKLCFTVLGDEIALIEGIGEVVRVTRDPPAMGVAFKQLTPASKELLARMIATEEP